MIYSLLVSTRPPPANLLLTIHQVNAKKRRKVKTTTTEKKTKHIGIFGPEKYITYTYTFGSEHLPFSTSVHLVGQQLKDRCVCIVYTTSIESTG